jgi:hypothetical protein
MDDSSQLNRAKDRRILVQRPVSPDGGRPKKKGGVYPVTAVRLPPALGAEVDKWASAQADPWCARWSIA